MIIRGKVVVMNVCLAAAGGLFLVLPPDASGSVAGTVNRGNAFYSKGDYEQAAKSYERALQKAPESDIIHFNYGAAFYKTGDYTQAVESFQKALLSDDPELKAKAHYNLGNALYRRGIEVEDTDIDAAVSGLEQALGQYESAMQKAPEDTDAADNHAFVARELERLRQKKREQQKRQDQKKGQQKDPRQGDPQSGRPEGLPKPEDKDGQPQNAPPSGQEFPDQSGRPGDDSQKEDKQPDQKRGEEKEAGGRQDARPRAADPKEMTSEEAEILLRDYQRNEEPEGLLNVHRRRSSEGPVKKDW